MKQLNKQEIETGKIDVYVSDEFFVRVSLIEIYQAFKQRLLEELVVLVDEDSAHLIDTGEKGNG